MENKRTFCEWLKELDYSKQYDEIFIDAFMPLTKSFSGKSYETVCESIERYRQNQLKGK